jgi:hydroxymethylbilane synthase
VAALAEVVDDALTLRGMVCALDGSTAVTDSASGNAADAESLGNGLAADLAARGGKDILAAICTAEDGTAS